MKDIIANRKLINSRIEKEKLLNRQLHSLGSKKGRYRLECIFLNKESSWFYRINLYRDDDIIDREAFEAGKGYDSTYNDFLRQILGMIELYAIRLLGVGVHNLPDAGEVID